MTVFWISLTLLLLLLRSSLKWLSYYCTVRGLLYFMELEYGAMPQPEKIKELRELALRRTLQEFFHLI